MKAWVIRKRGSIRDIDQIDVPAPFAGPDEVLIRVKAAAINPADLKVISGKDGGRFIHSGKPPIRLGYDFSGIIDQTGRGVSDFRRGDAVFGFLPYSPTNRQGSFADFVNVPSGTVARKPDSLPHVEAASAATVASTALQSLVGIGRIRTRQKVLINGASGGVGRYAVQIARDFEAEVWGTGSAASLDLTRSLGAGHALDYRTTRLRDLPQKFDIIFDVAARSSYRACAPIMKPKGVYVTLLPTPAFISGKLRTLFTNRTCALCMVKSRNADLSTLARMFDEKKLTATVARTFPMSELPEALGVSQAGAVRGKIGLIGEN